MGAIKKAELEKLRILENKYYRCKRTEKEMTTFIKEAEKKPSVIGGLNPYNTIGLTVGIVNAEKSERQKSIQLSDTKEMDEASIILKGLKTIRNIYKIEANETKKKLRDLVEGWESDIEEYK